MAATLKIQLLQYGPAKFVATSPSGATAIADGPADMGGVNAGLRPMEMMLAALASCSSLDVVHIMKKQRQDLQGLEVEVEGERADAIPAVFTHIRLRFRGHGPIELAKLEKAVALSMETYCSVARMLQPSVSITTECVVAGGAEG